MHARMQTRKCDPFDLIMHLLIYFVETSDMQGMMWGEPELVTWHCSLCKRYRSVRQLVVARLVSVQQIMCWLVLHSL